VSASSVSAEIAALLARGTTSCRLWAEQDEGPYRRDHHPARRDVTADRVGVPLALGLGLRSLDGTALATAVVEIWHCDAAGRYSGFPPPDSSSVPTADRAPKTEYLADQLFLRGSQVTDDQGRVEFRTIYPGWYPGRTVHIHVIVRLHAGAFTSQLYFPESVTEAVFACSPYSQRPGRDTTNATDEIFPTGGEPAVLDLESVDAGYHAGSRLVLPGAPD
jgi:protocatechuate 3,4-dioxygenase beta subunit